MKKNKNLWSLLFIGPHLILFLIFFLVPAFFGIVIAFTDWDLYNTPVFVGLDNFKTILFNKDSIYYEQFFNGAKNTMIFVFFAVPTCVIFPLFMAILLSTKPKLYKLFQSIIYLPSLFAISAVVLIWAFLLSLSFGPLTHLFGLNVNIVSNQPYAWIALIVVTLWWCIGNNLIIFIAALNTVPKQEIEAAKIDGAGIFARFFKVILPNIRPQLLFTTVMTTILHFNVYGQALMLTTGGPNNSTRVLMMYIRQNAFGSGISAAGISSAMSVLLGIIILVFSAFWFFINSRLEK